MGAPLPARIQPGSIDHVPSQQLELVLGRLWLYERKLAVEKSLSLPVPGHRCVHRRGNRNASCSAGVAWSESVAGVRQGGRQRGRQTGLLSAAKLICVGESQDPSPGQTNPPPRRIVLCPPDPYRAKELPGDP
ncbi:hypothetical protein QVD17_37854 [Tagetes erecta]|uniref:Uncharacterized protein n=1 Tax=Tagetes erecta TaxID=13708 RepID=A0AAD8JVG6_TARER|nr:hypothetical protein QVD17_37854 [Tagetes erecta]